MKTLSSIAAALTLLASPAYALDLGHDFKLSGFGTVGVLTNTSPSADFAQFYFQPKGTGKRDSTTLDADSKVGLQLDWQATERLSFTGQAITKKWEDSDWSPRLEWAFAKYQVLPELALRAGRIRPSLYMLSDYLDINFANPWVRPPVEFYSTAPINRMEGVDVIWRPKTGPVSWVVQPFYGNTTDKATDGRTLTIGDLYGGNVSASIGDFTVRAAYSQGSLSSYIESFTTKALPAFNALCGLMRDPIACTKLGELRLDTSKQAVFGSLGAAWDNGDYFVSGEWGKTANQSFLSDKISWYLSGGTRIGKWTPYVTYSTVENTSPSSFSGSNVFLPPVGPSTNYMVSELLVWNAFDQQTFSVGMRYDLLDNVAIKLQWDRTDTFTKNGQARTGGGLFYYATDQFKNASNALDLISLNVDFVF